MQGARSGLLPVEYLSNGATTFSQCIGLFSMYDAGGASPGYVNSTLVSLGYNVSPAASAAAAVCVVVGVGEGVWVGARCGWVSGLTRQTLHSTGV